MKIKLQPFDSVKKHLTDLNASEEFGSDTTMFHWTSEFNGIDIPPAMVAIAFSDDDNIIGWSGVGYLGSSQGFGHLSTYINPKFRQQGLGTELILVAIQAFSSIRNERNCIVLEMDLPNSCRIEAMILSLGFDTLPFIDDIYDYRNDEIWQGKNPKYLSYHKYLKVKVIDCECLSCTKQR